jgi:hypothetical protein
MLKINKASKKSYKSVFFSLSQSTKTVLCYTLHVQRKKKQLELKPSEPKDEIMEINARVRNKNKNCAG